MRFLAISMAALAAAGSFAPAQAGQLPPSGRFQAELLAFADANSAQTAQTDTLFIGSSSIRLWNVKADFEGYQPVNHGFGGATVADVLANYDLLVTGYRPKTIIVYVGENDIVQGREAGAVATDVLTLLAQLRRDFPAARIAYLSMKYSPGRLARRSDFKNANRQVREQATAGRSFDYVDASAILMLADGTPDSACFSPDGIHLSTVGYQRWRKIVEPYLPARAVGAISAEVRPAAATPSAGSNGVITPVLTSSPAR